MKSEPPLSPVAGGSHDSFHTTVGGGGGASYCRGGGAEVDE